MAKAKTITEEVPVFETVPAMGYMAPEVSGLGELRSEDFQGYPSRDLTTPIESPAPAVEPIEPPIVK